MAKAKSKPRKHKLTDKFLRALKPMDHTYLVWDTHQTGFGIQVTVNGAKSFKCLYRYGGKTVWFHIDRYPAIGLADARKAAQNIRGRVVAGEHPQQKKKDDRKAKKDAKEAVIQSETLQDVAARYVEGHAKRKNKSWRQGERLMRGFVLPYLGTREIVDIDRKDVQSIFRYITDQGHEVHANQVKAAFSAMLTWAVDEQLIPFNPAMGIKRNKTKVAERFLSDHEVQLVWAKFEDLGFAEARVLRLILTSAQRPGECTHMRWEDLDWQKQIWTLPGKPVGDWPGTKNAMTQELPLTPQALVLLDELGPQEEGRVFPIRRIPSAKKIWQELGIPHFRAHDLRATATTGMDALGFHHEDIARVLNHTDKTVTGGYRRKAPMEQKRRALEAWGTHLEAVVEGRKPPSVVVPIRSQEGA